MEIDLGFGVDGFRIAFWKIEESSEELLSMIGGSLQDVEKENFLSMKNERRRAEWLATRILLQRMLGRYAEIRYDSGGKPFYLGLDDKTHYISVSHADGMVALMIGVGDRFGIDIEKRTGRIYRIREKFLLPAEIESIDPDLMMDSLYVHWCAKEAMYKAVNVDNWDYQNTYALESLTLREPGSATTGRMLGGGKVASRFNVRYAILQDYVVCAAVEI